MFVTLRIWLILSRTKLSLVFSGAGLRQRLTHVALLLLGLELDWAAIADLLEDHVHAFLSLESRLQFGKKVRLLDLQLFGIFLGVIGVILFIRHSLVITVSQVVFVEIAHRVVQ